jgi:hypothetical protein
MAPLCAADPPVFESVDSTNHCASPLELQVRDGAFTAVPKAILVNVNEKLTEHAPVTAPVVYVVPTHDPATHVPPTAVSVV